ncbi:hypothetical protein BJ508DRAFT_364980 [Ascobolus immersus RN42]|uniref:Uncharacterized protein n=1 Tax=Ascobolus immersus RN42 TaxID=1160509 RepID=A0A3N4HU35_ASCIM|nr:hypothetical protein BJ508DRAFT_364980 [Ascobolus immersus RN42]
MPYYKGPALRALSDKCDYAVQDLFAGPREEIRSALRIFLPLIHVPLDRLANEGGYFASVIRDSMQYDKRSKPFSKKSINQTTMSHIITALNDTIRASAVFEKLIHDFSREQSILSLVKRGHHRHPSTIGWMERVGTWFGEWWSGNIFVYPGTEEEKVIKKWQENEGTWNWYWYLDAVEEIRQMALELSELAEDLLELKKRKDEQGAYGFPESSSRMAGGRFEQQQPRRRRV